jgi:hypothetical protein
VRPFHGVFGASCVVGVGRDIQGGYLSFWSNALVANRTGVAADVPLSPRRSRRAPFPSSHVAPTTRREEYSEANLHQRGIREGSPRPLREEIRVAALAAGCVNGATTVNIKELLALKGGGEETVEVIGNSRLDSPTAARTKHLEFFAEDIIERTAAGLNGPIRRYTDTTERNDGSSGPVSPNHPSGGVGAARLQVGLP